jgi:hypothetical protein
MCAYDRSSGFDINGNKWIFIFLFYPPNPVIFVYVECSVRFVVDMKTTVTTSQNLCVAW